MAAKLGMTNAELIDSINSDLGNVVTLNGDQTISGAKQFSQPTQGMSIELIADTNQQTIPTPSVIRQLGLYRDATYTKGDGYTSWIQSFRGEDGSNTCVLYVRRYLESDTDEIINYLGVAIKSDGTPVAFTKTPPIYSGGEEMVTAEWFNTKIQVVSALPANPDPNTFYFIPE